MLHINQKLELDLAPSGVNGSRIGSGGCKVVWKKCIESKKGAGEGTLQRLFALSGIMSFLIIFVDIKKKKALGGKQSPGGTSV